MGENTKIEWCDFTFNPVSAAALLQEDERTRQQMNDVQSTIVGLKAQECPGGGWTGMPRDLERPTVADCLAHGVCGCIYGDAVQHIERLQRIVDLVMAHDSNLIDHLERHAVEQSERQER